MSKLPLPDLTQKGPRVRIVWPTVAAAAVAALVLSLLGLALTTSRSEPSGLAPGAVPGSAHEAGRSVRCLPADDGSLTSCRVGSGPDAPPPAAASPDPSVPSGEFLPDGATVDDIEFGNDCVAEGLADTFTKEEILRFGAADPGALTPELADRLGEWQETSTEVAERCGLLTEGAVEFAPLAGGGS